MILFSVDSEVDERRVQSQYVSRRDALVVITVICVLGLLLYPLWRDAASRAKEADCVKNIRKIGQALGTYTDVNNDTLPPTFNQTSSGTPARFNDTPVTWITQTMEYLSEAESLQCPSAVKVEASENLNPFDSEDPLVATYGMYRGASAVPLNRIEFLRSSVAIAETANAGTTASYNPSPFIEADGRIADQDGFVIGWNDDNMVFSTGSNRVTRLAFSNTSSGDFSGSAVKGRHGRKIHALALDGSLIILTPRDTLTKRLDHRLVGLWFADPVLMK